MSFCVRLPESVCDIWWGLELVAVPSAGGGAKRGTWPGLLCFICICESLVELLFSLGKTCPTELGPDS